MSIARRSFSFDDTYALRLFAGSSRIFAATENGSGIMCYLQSKAFRSRLFGILVQCVEAYEVSYRFVPTHITNLVIKAISFTSSHDFQSL